MPEIGRPCDFHGIPQKDVIAIGIAVLDDAEQPGVFGHGRKDAHVLHPPVSEDVLR